MGIADQVMTEMKAAMRSKNKPRLGALRMIRATIIEANKAGGGEPSEADLVKHLRRMAKQRADAADSYDKGGAPDKAAEERAEIAVINEFLPQLADEATTLQWVQAAIAQSGATEPKHMGKAMGALMKAHKGDVDGGLARRLLQAELSAG